jgi:hypothetical protein
VVTARERRILNNAIHFVVFELRQLFYEDQNPEILEVVKHLDAAVIKLNQIEREAAQEAE